MAADALIPGVKYTVDLGTHTDGYPEHVVWMYTPWWADDPEPWIDEDRETHEWDPKYTIVGVDYNPHDESTEDDARLEWGYGEVNGPFYGPYPEDKVRRLVAAHTFITGNSDWHIFQREVCTTKWKQIV